MADMFEDTINLEEELLSGLEAFDLRDDIVIPDGLYEHDRWVCASAMQKAVRRGQVDMAMKAGVSLLHLKPEQLWSRLAVTVQEDIGGANIKLVGLVLWVVGKKAWRHNHGGDVKVLQYLLILMCASHKSRLANDLLCIANYHIDYKKDAHDYFMYSDAYLGDIIQSPDYNLVQKTLASWYIAGVQPRNAFHLHPKQGSHKALFGLYHKLNYPPYVMDCIRMGMGKGEGHARVMGMSHQSHLKAEDKSIIDQCHQPSIQIRHWFSESYDAHTRTGKYAYREFIKRNDDIRHILEKEFPDKDHVAILGMIVFGIEGQKMNNRVTYHEVDEITHTALECYVDEYYRDELQMLLEDLVEDRMDDIHACRAKHA
jgi:hypothetical protein